MRVTVSPRGIMHAVDKGWTFCGLNLKLGSRETWPTWYLSSRFAWDEQLDRCRKCNAVVQELNTLAERKG